MEIENKKVIITGASSGIGAASARELANQGAEVILIARSSDKLKALVSEIKQTSGKAHYYQADVGHAKQVQNISKKILKNHGSPDILINNAGIGRWLYIEETPWEEIDSMIRVPFLAAVYMTRAFMKAMLDKSQALIINVNSPVCFMPWPGATTYASARGALRTFSQALQNDLHGTTVKCLHFVPGKVNSEYFKNNPGAEERIPKVDKLVKTLTPEQVAQKLVKCIHRERKETIFPFLLKLTEIQGRFFPRATNWMVRTSGHKR